MNRFRNYVLMAGGFAVLVLVVGVFSAGPAIAQAVRAALVSNVDDPGRIPYRVVESFSQQDCEFGCQGGAPLVPAGKRLVITNVSGDLSTTVPGGTWISLTIGQFFSHHASVPMISSGSTQGTNFFGFNQQVLIVIDPGDGLNAIVFNGGGAGHITSAVITLSGYLLDCTTAPCAALNP
jgi:hypothetical protein